MTLNHLINKGIYLIHTVTLSHGVNRFLRNKQNLFFFPINPQNKIYYLRVFSTFIFL